MTEVVVVIGCDEWMLDLEEEKVAGGGPRLVVMIGCCSWRREKGI